MLKREKREKRSGSAGMGTAKKWERIYFSLDE